MSALPQYGSHLHPSATMRAVLIDRYGKADVLREAFPAKAGKLPKRRLPSFVIRLLAPLSGDLKTFSFELDKRRFVSGDKAEQQLLSAPYISGRDALIASGETLLDYGAVA